MSSRPFAAACLLAGVALLGACAGGTDPTGAAFVRADAEAVAEVAVALERLAGGDRAGAFATLEAVVARHPDSYEAQLEFARLAATNGSTAPALAAYQALFAANLAAGVPHDPSVARGLTRLALFLGQTDVAVEASASLAGPGATAADLALAARAAFESGDPATARLHAEAAVAADPRDAEAHHQLALALLELPGAAVDATQTTGAQASLRKAIQEDPGRIEARFLLGTLMLQADDTIRGERLLEVTELVRELDTPGFLALEPRARIRRARQIAEEVPAWSRPLLEVARAQLALGQPAKADETLAEAMQLKPKTLELYKLRYAAAIARNDPKAQKNWLQRWTDKRSQDE
ncbi:MAG: hypothetical protein P1V81_13365 [Planctomycetota bacterium]|nr:hypothetical protein [Planctomycetota bacterium]